MIKIENLTFGYESSIVLNKINLEVNDGDYVAVIGDNGTGKSTFIKCLIGLNQVNHNEIKIDDVCLSCYNKFSEIGYVPQMKPRASELPITSREIFKLVTKDQEKINEVIKRLSITDLVDENINNLSGGQRQRVNIAKAMLNDIKYLILDEPSTGLDLKSRVSLYNLLTGLNLRGLTIIVVSHHLDEIKSDVNKILNLNEGNI